MCWSSGMASSPMRLASCPSQWPSLVCKRLTPLVIMPSGNVTFALNRRCPLIPSASIPSVPVASDRHHPNMSTMHGPIWNCSTSIGTRHWTRYGCWPMPRRSCWMHLRMSRFETPLATLMRCGRRWTVLISINSCSPVPFTGAISTPSYAPGHGQESMSDASQGAGGHPEG